MFSSVWQWRYTLCQETEDSAIFLSCWWYSPSGAVKTKTYSLLLEWVQSAKNRSNILVSKGKIPQCLVRQNSCWSQWEFCLNKYWVKTMMFDLDLSESHKSRSNMCLRLTTTVPQYSCSILFKGKHSNSKLWIICCIPYVYKGRQQLAAGQGAAILKICQSARLKKKSLPTVKFWKSDKYRKVRKWDSQGLLCDWK